MRAKQSKSLQVYKTASICSIIIYLFLSAIPAICRAGDDTITILAVGDIYLGGSANAFLKQKGYSYPFEAMKDIVANADIAVANLEAPATNHVEVFMEKEFIVKTSPEAIEAIKGSGFDVVTLANNHIMDYGAIGLKDTIELLDKAKIRYAGAGKDLKHARMPAIINIKGTKIAFLAYSKVFPEEFYATNESSGTAPGFIEYVRDDIKDIKKLADIIVVSFHWSEELLKYPKEYQVKLAHLSIDSGASLVIGHHPHVIQEIERYKDGLILYSVGNFIFGSYGQYRAEGVMILVKFTKSRIASAEIIPLNINNKEVSFQPQLFNDDKAQEILQHIQELSESPLMLTVIKGKGYLRFAEGVKAAALP